MIYLEDYPASSHDVMNSSRQEFFTGRWGLVCAILVTTICYWPGLSGGWLFDDYPNIVDNLAVQPQSGNVRALIGAALSSPASDFKRPLASLSFATNFLVSGLDPYWMKLTNLVIHLLNGVLVFLVARALFRAPAKVSQNEGVDKLAALVAASWLLLPINITSVLYVVQRMESIANLFVLLGLLWYVSTRRRMLDGAPTWTNIGWCLISLSVPTAIGLLAKETAVMLPLYALLTEWLLFGFRRTSGGYRDGRIVCLFGLVLALPMTIGLAWLIPELLRPEAWATRDYNMGTRVLTEARVVADYVGWTLLPLPHALSFYHDDYPVSTGLFSPCSTAASALVLAALTAFAAWLRKSQPVASLGIVLFVGSHLLTGTILPLELVYEHRNYFASFGLMLAVVTLLFSSRSQQAFPLRRAILVLFGTLMLWWTCITSMSAYGWGDSLRLARMLAERDPQSPRAQYELGRTYIIYSNNIPSSPYTRLAYEPLERAASLPQSSILPQQALIFMNSRMGLPLKDAWWESMDAKLIAVRPGVQDESSLAALVQCVEHGQCRLPQERMQLAFEAAMTHSNPSPRLLATYAEYAWNVMGKRQLGLDIQTRAVNGAPREAAYLATLIRMLLAQGDSTQAQQRLRQLEQLNVGGHLDAQVDTLRKQIVGAEVESRGSRSP